jgi:hypothetical protein
MISVFDQSSVIFNPFVCSELAIETASSGFITKQGYSVVVLCHSTFLLAVFSAPSLSLLSNVAESSSMINQ